jgi:uncharacterized protein
MRVTHTLLSDVALRAVVEEFVTRDGTDHSSVVRRIEAIMAQLNAGNAEIHYDDETKSCSIVSKQ